jgi:hypothetical protein
MKSKTSELKKQLALQSAISVVTGGISGFFGGYLEQVVVQFKKENHM